MKRFLISILALCLIPMCAYADDFEPNYYEYHSQIEEFDTSMFDDELDENTKSILKDLGIDEFDVENISNLNFSSALNIVKDMVLDKAKIPLFAVIEILAFIILSSFVNTFKGTFDSSLENLYSTLSGLIIIILLFTKITNVLLMSAGVIKICADFIYAFIPTFFIILASGGGMITSISTNTFLLLLSQFLSFISSTLFLPLVNGYMAIGICSSVNSELNFDRIVVSLKHFIIKIISVLSATFVSILSIKTAVASRADALGLRSMRFAINSVVPVIGSAISEGLLSIQSYSSLIKTSVGIVGVIAISLVFLPSIIETTIWRISLSVCLTFANVFDNKNVSNVISVFKDVLLLVNVILILSMLTSIVSFGILIAARTG